MRAEPNRAGVADLAFDRTFHLERDLGIDVAFDCALDQYELPGEVLRQGGYEREFFISQTPDLVDEADAVIDVVALATQ
ncbi:hypothetical protein VZ52_20670 [Ralstonia mannitolilytica]|nr:hypothetical protein VZ52_20670 [Ralstonia mannitolilytica]